MAGAVKNMVLSNGGTAELSPEERNLLSVAYKNITGARRASWRILSSLENKEENRISGGTGSEGSAKKLEQTKAVRNRDR